MEILSPGSVLSGLAVFAIVNALPVENLQPDVASEDVAKRTEGSICFGQRFGLLGLRQLNWQRGNAATFQWQPRNKYRTWRGGRNNPGG
ncbi:hypothetical protein OG21DRAFT_1510580 [Imleria badia]|nr:hypothetical protein OG21DRAFT_1510580 [Imleria badia]